jgi:hypothetical protein
VRTVLPHPLPGKVTGIYHASKFYGYDFSVKGAMFCNFANQTGKISGKNRESRS